MGRRADAIGLLGTLVLVAGCESPAVPDRIAPYEFRSAGDVFRWPAARLPVRFYVPPVGRLPDFVADGLRRWEQQFVYGEFRAEVTGDSLTADVIVQLEGAVPPDAIPTGAVPPAGACTQAQTVFPPHPNGQLTDVVRILLRVPTGQPPATIADCLVLQAAHEVGHGLGILRESDGDDDLMNTNPRTGEPSLRDRATVQALYQTAPTLTPRERPE